MSIDTQDNLKTVVVTPDGAMIDVVIRSLLT